MEAENGIIKANFLEEEAMAEHTYEELKKKTVVELRAIAEGLGDEAVKGYRR